MYINIEKERLVLLLLLLLPVASKYRATHGPCSSRRARRVPCLGMRCIPLAAREREGKRIARRFGPRHLSCWVKRSTGHTHTTADQTTHTNTVRATAAQRHLIVQVVVATPKLPPSCWVVNEKEVVCVFCLWVGPLFSECVVLHWQAVHATEKESPDVLVRGVFPVRWSC